MRYTLFLLLLASCVSVPEKGCKFAEKNISQEEEIEKDKILIGKKVYQSKTIKKKEPLYKSKDIIKEEALYKSEGRGIETPFNNTDDTKEFKSPREERKLIEMQRAMSEHKK